MKGKGKGKGKKGGDTFKLTPKVTDDRPEYVNELQIKKKLLEDKLIIAQKRAIEARKNLNEAREKLFDTQNVGVNESNKFNSIRADFINQKSLVDKIYTDQLNALNKTKGEREIEKEILKNQMDELKKKFQEEIDKRNKLTNTIKTQMDELSKNFSEQLAQIQKNLQEQIDNISKKWESNSNNAIDHIEKYKDHVKKYDIFK